MIGCLRWVFQPGQELGDTLMPGRADLNHQPARRDRNNEEHADLLECAARQEEQQAAHHENCAGSTQVRLLVDQATDHSQDHAQREQAQA